MKLRIGCKAIRVMSMAVGETVACLDSTAGALPFDLVVLCVTYLDYTEDDYVLALFDKCKRDEVERTWLKHTKIENNDQPTYRETRVNGKLHSLNDEPALVYYGPHYTKTMKWYRNGAPHRAGDNPALITSDGSRYWYQNGVLHRDCDDQPALITSFGDRSWYRNGKLHREGDQPARVSRINYEKTWCVDGELHRDTDRPARIRFCNQHGEDNDETMRCRDCLKYWFRHGQLHRENGPAVMNTSYCTDGVVERIQFLPGNYEWYIEGVKQQTQTDH